MGIARGLGIAGSGGAGGSGAGGSGIGGSGAGGSGAGGSGIGGSGGAGGDIGRRSGGPTTGPLLSCISPSLTRKGFSFFSGFLNASHPIIKSAQTWQKSTAVKSSTLPVDPLLRS
ncbi:MAG: hypothetical protein E7045_02005 [Lentisphaerae bacterium]|nr:hypothetical protein [Lentisphaerota bacterium]